MVHLIDKDALVAKIEKRRDKHFNFGGSPSSEYCYEDDEILSIIDTLKVKKVDLEKEIDKFYGMYRDKNGVTHDMQDNEICLDWKEDCNYHFKIEFAKHFFELGIKVNNEKEK